MKKLALSLLALTLATFSVSHAHAQANLSFSGGLGAPLTLTLSAPVTYVITTATPGTMLIFVFQGTGNLGGGDHLATSTITATVNNGAPNTLTSFQSNSTIGTALTPNDSILYTNYTVAPLAVGDVVQLSAGTATTTYGTTVTPPTATSFPTYMNNRSGTRITAINGASVAPEPSTWAMLGLGAAGFGVVVLRRRQEVRG